MGQLEEFNSGITSVWLAVLTTVSGNSHVDLGHHREVIAGRLPDAGSTTTRPAFDRLVSDRSSVKSRQGAPLKMQFMGLFHHSVGTPGQPAKAGSPVMITRESTMACAASMRSNEQAAGFQKEFDDDAADCAQGAKC